MPALAAKIERSFLCEPIEPNVILALERQQVESVQGGVGPASLTIYTLDDFTYDELSSPQDLWRREARRRYYRE